MRRTLRRMIATGTLSAFSALNGIGTPTGVSRPVQTARAQTDTQTTAPRTTTPPVLTQPAPGQILPRGSLLNLSV